MNTNAQMDVSLHVTKKVLRVIVANLGTMETSVIFYALKTAILLNVLNQKENVLCVCKDSLGTFVI